MPTHGRIPRALKPFDGAQRRGTAAAAVLLLASGGITADDSWAGGGTKPSLAPPAAVGQQYLGSIGRENRTEFWRLPPLIASDVVTLAWSTTQQTTACVLANVDDYSWDTGVADLCGDNYGDENGRRLKLSVPQSTPNAFLVFDDPVSGGMSRDDVPYEFTVESIQHWLGVGVRRVSTLSRSGTLTASISSGDNTAAPNGLAFQLTARWSGQRRTYRATTVSGKASFKLRLPRSASGRRVSFSVSRPADATYLAAKSRAQTIRVR